MAKTIAKVNVAAAYNKRSDFLSLATNNIDTIEDIHISLGNSKMGKIPSFSVLPLITCTNCGECSKHCYACKGCFNFNNNIMNLAENTTLVNNKPEFVIDSINKFLDNTTTIYKYFRFNVAGDIFNEKYFNIVLSVAIKNPVTRFLVFTKNYDMVNEYLRHGNDIPENLVIVFSKWNNTDIYNPYNLPVAIVKTDESTIIPDNSYHCSGDCSNCLECWNAENKTTRYFDLH